MPNRKKRKKEKGNLLSFAQPDAQGLGKDSQLGSEIKLCTHCLTHKDTAAERHAAPRVPAPGYPRASIPCFSRLGTVSSVMLQSCAPVSEHSLVTYGLTQENRPPTNTLASFKAPLAHSRCSSAQLGDPTLFTHFPWDTGPPPVLQ